MCGRYVFRNKGEAADNPLANSALENSWSALNINHARYNIAPTQLAPVITQQGAVDMALTNWGTV